MPTNQADPTPASMRMCKSFHPKATASQPKNNFQVQLVWHCLCWLMVTHCGYTHAKYSESRNYTKVVSFPGNPYKMKSYMPMAQILSASRIEIQQESQLTLLTTKPEPQRSMNLYHCHINKLKIHMTSLIDIVHGAYSISTTLTGLDTMIRLSWKTVKKKKICNKIYKKKKTWRFKIGHEKTAMQ